MSETIARADFDLPGQLGPVERGKVADIYTLSHPIGDLLVAVRTDRISAFDEVLPALIPDKGHILNAMSAEMLRQIGKQVPNWFLDEPDPNVTIGYKAEEVVKVEMIVRANLTGGAWDKYQTEGLRNFSGEYVPDDMKKFDLFPRLLVTPTTKVAKGDAPITPEEIIDRRLATSGEVRIMYGNAVRLFTMGQRLAREKGLTLGDAKYEFGRQAGRLILIDEVNTPDSSRYYEAEGLDNFVAGRTDKPPKELSKEFIRDWLREQGFEGLPGQTPPAEIPNDIIEETNQRYIEVFERFMGKPFERPDENINPQTRMWANILAGIDRISGR